MPSPGTRHPDSWSEIAIGRMETSSPAESVISASVPSGPLFAPRKWTVTPSASSGPSAANSSITSLCRVSVMRDGCFRSSRSGTTRTAFISPSRRTLLITGPSSRPRWVRWSR